LASVVRGLSWALGCPPRRRGRSLLRVVVEPVLLRVVEGVNHLGDQFVLFGDLQHGARVFVAAAVVRGRENREQLAGGEALEAVHDALVRAQDKPRLVVLQEQLDPIGTELDDVASAVGVSYKVWLDAKVLITVGRI